MSEPWHCRQIPNGLEPIIVCEKDDLLARIDELEAALHIPQSCTTVQDLVDHLGERQAYTKIVADSIGHRGRIAELEAALREIERSGPLTVCHEVARQALGETTND